jgi:hypothetical protein
LAGLSSIEAVKARSRELLPLYVQRTGLQGQEVIRPYTISIGPEVRTTPAARFDNANISAVPVLVGNIERIDPAFDPVHDLFDRIPPNASIANVCNMFVAAATM